MSHRVCSSCARELLVSEFSPKHKGGGQLQSKCKACVREYSRQHYHRNKHKYLDRIAAQNKRYKDLRRQVVIEAKDRPCTDCGGRFSWYCMEFDHRDPTTKVGDIGNLKNSNISIPKFLEELAKTDCVCANCHRARTFHRHETRSRCEPAIETESN